MSQKRLNDEELYRQKYRKLLHFEINILNILNIFTEIIGMAPPINVQDWYGDRHTCQIASDALGPRGGSRVRAQLTMSTKSLDLVIMTFIRVLRN